MRSHHFRTLAQVCKSRAAQLCIRSAKHACSQALASTGWNYHKANATITKMYLHENKIGDGGAIALAASLKATLVMRFRPVRATLFLWPARTQPHRRRPVICVTSVFRCWSVGVARAHVFQMCYCDKMSCGHVMSGRRECRTVTCACEAPD